MKVDYPIVCSGLEHNSLDYIIYCNELIVIIIHFRHNSCMGVTATQNQRIDDSPCLRDENFLNKHRQVKEVLEHFIGAQILLV